MVLRKMLLLFLVSFLCILSCKNGTAPDDDTKSVVLQNGLNGYAGCIDSHIFFKGDAPDSQTTNFASRAVLKTTNCPT